MSCPELVVRSGVTRCHYGGPHDFSRAVFRPRQPRAGGHNPTVRRRTLNKIDFDVFNEQLARADWFPVFMADSTSSKWDAFLRTFMALLDTVAPVRQIRTRQTGAPPVTAQTKELIKRRSRALRNDASDYSEVNRLCRAAIRRDCVEHVKRELARAGRNGVWRTLRPLIGRKQQQTTVPSITPDALNDYYASVGPATAASVPRLDSTLPVRLPRVTSGSFKVQAVNIDTLYTTLQSMRASNSTGSDGFSVFMAQRFFAGMGYALLDVVNSCLTTCEIPSGWKHALVTPIPKVGKASNNDPAGTRPISILPAAMKIVEKVVQSQLVDYLESADLLSGAQHGYRRGYSTETALHVITDKILQAMDGGEISILVLIDLSKCFDVVPHEILLQKLSTYGIDTEWFRCYLEGHTQQVQIMNRDGTVAVSKSKRNEIGVFQGGSLSCILYMLYANDLSLFTPDTVSIVQFADDTQLLITGKKCNIQAMVTEIETALHTLFKWFCSHHMKVNTQKTQMLVLGTPAMLRSLQPVQIRFCGAIVHESRVVKNLGVTMDRHLSYQPHIDKLTQKCNGVLIALSHAKNTMPRSVIKPIVQALAVSIVRYCISIYGSCTETQLHRVQKVLNFCARVVTGRRKHDHISDAFLELGWFNAHELKQYHQLCVFHRSLTTGQPEQLASTFGHTANQRHGHDTRRASELTLPRIHTEAGRKRLNYNTARAYNSLPFAPHPTAFRPQLKKYLLAKRHIPD